MKEKKLNFNNGFVSEMCNQYLSLLFLMMFLYYCIISTFMFCVRKKYV